MTDRDDNLDEALMAQLAAGLEPVQPAPERARAMREKLFRRIHAESRHEASRQAEPAPVAQAPAPAEHLTLRSTEGRWLQVAPGIRMKPLNREQGMWSYLLELEAGRSLPAHDHAEDEECMVLAGDVWLGEVHAFAGDYHLAKKGVPHGVIRTDSGCTLFLRGARPELPRAAR